VELLPDPVQELVATLTRVPGVVAIVLGGSRARDLVRPDSDYDIGLYYDEERPFATASIAEVAKVAAGADAEVTDLYGWGPWVNGGAWLTVGGHKVDLLYKNIQQVRRTIEACTAGEVELDFAQQPPFGFFTYTYLGETRWCLPLHDPWGTVADLKELVADYPEALRARVVPAYLNHVDFTLRCADAPATRGDAYLVVGSLTRAAVYLNHALLAHNRGFFINEKSILVDLAGMHGVPTGYADRVQALLAAPTASADDLVARVGELRALYEEAQGIIGTYEPPSPVEEREDL
jgi:hypothetical protein